MSLLKIGTDQSKSKQRVTNKDIKCKHFANVIMQSIMCRGAVGPRMPTERFQQKPELTQELEARINKINK